MFIYFSFFLSVSVCLYVRSFSFSSSFKGTTLIWAVYRFTLPHCVFAFVCSTNTYCMIISAPIGRNILKAIAVSLHRWRMTIDNYGVTMKRFHVCTVQKELKKKVTYTHT